MSTPVPLHLLPAPFAWATESTPTPSLPALPSVPVLPGTLLGLELLLQRPALDLRAARDLLHEDPGALLHLFAMISEEFPDAADRPTRLEDCIASLSADRLLRTLARAGGARREQARFAHFAHHAAAIARFALPVADSLGLPREQAMLVGALHELGSLPSVLGWSPLLPPEREAVLRCEDLGRRYGLPRDLRRALDALHRALPGSVWVAVIAAAHDLLGAALPLAQIPPQHPSR